MRDDYPEAEDTELAGIDMSNGNGNGLFKTVLATVGGAIIIAQLTWIGVTLVSQGKDIATLNAQMAFVIDAVREKK